MENYGEHVGENNSLRHNRSFFLHFEKFKFVKITCKVVFFFCFFFLSCHEFIQSARLTIDFLVKSTYCLHCHIKHIYLTELDNDNFILPLFGISLRMSLPNNGIINKISAAKTSSILQ